MADRFRILHLAASDRGGPGHSALRLHAGLLALDQDSSLLVREQKSKQRSIFQAQVDLPPEVKEPAFAVDVFQRWYLDYNRTNLSNSLFTLGETGLDLEEHPLVQDAEILHLHSVARFLSPASISRLASLGKPVVWTLHDHRPFTGGCHFPAGCPKFTDACSGCPQLGWDPYFITEAQLGDELEMIPARRIRFVSPTQFLANKARESALLKNARIQVIPYGIDTRTFQLKWKPQAKSHLGLETGTLHLLFVANQLGEMRKGFHHLARAIQVCLSRPQFKEKAEKGEIALISLGHPHPSLGSLGIPYVSLGHLESDEEMSQLYGAADLFLLPSLEENLPNTLLESMSCGTPVVAFSAGGIPELVTHDVNGKLVPTGSDAEFAMAIEETLFDDGLRQRLADNAREMIVARFSLRAQAENYFNLYRELMRGLPRSPRKEEMAGFGPGNDFKVEKLAPIGSRIRQICTDSLPRPLLDCLFAMENQLAANGAELHELKNDLESQQATIEQLQTDLDEQRGVLRKQETQILKQNQILGSGAIKMLRQLKLIKK